jgi:putative transposase
MKGDTLANEQLRIKALELYHKNWQVAEICSALNCSKSWFHKWLNRYKTGDRHWYKEQSRAPKTVQRKTSLEMEQLIIETRKQLVAKPFCQYGPQAIFYNLEQKGITPPPVWEIARILERHKLSRTKRALSYMAKGKSYPYSYVNCQQMDFVGPRYLRSKVRFYFNSLICCDTHFAHLFVSDKQTSDIACRSLLQFWKKAGIPDFLQMDNYLAFWGSLIRPNALGKVIRLCLMHEVIPVFIPIKEPWRNGIIEHFNKTMQSAILNSASYKTIDDIQDACNRFCMSHNANHHYSTQEGKTPLQCQEYLQYPLKRLNKKYDLQQKALPLEDGEIHVIRFIRSNLKFNIFGLSYRLPKETEYEYIKGVIRTDEHRLIIFKDQDYVTEFEFTLY